ncbi:isopeptide-forming domain-containing fimbrial protein [Enterococcus faecalis]|uniref:isopeptide-forming domain-containing fimbrial protein n=1 Tax=Enterococcus faecalis TaxID=1351 RepID=UPI0004101535|nr:isopeptide-forming domain-containing fimbrial protein [Enterococcus faecalis]
MNLSKKQKKQWKKRLGASVVLLSSVGGIMTTSLTARTVLAEENKKTVVPTTQSTQTKDNKKKDILVNPNNGEKAVKTKSVLKASEYIPVQEDKNTTVVEDGTLIPSKYEFNAQFVKGKTTVEYLGDGWKDKIPVQGGLSESGKHIFHNDIVKGETGVIYHNVSVQGEEVDLRIMVKDFTKLTKYDDAFIAFNDAYAIGFWLNSRMNDLTVENTYLKAGTTEEIEMNGFQTWSDIDWLQSVTLPKSTVDKVDQIIVSPDSWLQVQNNDDGSKKYAELDNVGSEDLDPWAMFTALFTGVSTFEYTFSTNKDLNAELTEDWDGALAWLGNSGYKPAGSEVPAPTKDVTDSDELNVQHNTLENMQEGFTFTVSQTIPGETEKFFHKSFSMTDILIPELEPVGNVRTVDETGEDRSNYFIDKSKDNTVHVVATEEALKTQDFYAHTYSFIFDAQVRSGQSLDKYLQEDGKYHFPNTAKTTIDGKDKDTPTTETVVEDVDTNPQKSFMEKDGSESKDEKIGKKGDEVTYSVRNQLPYNLAGKSLRLTDNVNQVIAIKPETVKVEVTDDNVEEQAPEKGPKPTSERDEKAELAKWIAKGNTYLNHSEAYDQATLKELEKAIEHASATLADENVSKEALQKEIDTLIGLSKRLEGKETAEKVKPEKAKWVDVTDKGTLTVDEKTGQIQWTMSDAGELSGKHYRMSFSGVLKEDVDFSKEKQEDGYAVIPNVVTEEIGDKKKETNEVVYKVKEEPKEETPETPVTPDKPETPTPETPEKPQFLPNTGMSVGTAASAVAIMATTALAGTAYIVKRKKFDKKGD